MNRGYNLSFNQFDNFIPIIKNNILLITEKSAIITTLEQDL